MKPESKLWQMVKKNLPDVHWTRLESWAMPGVPDVYGIQDGISVFVELKVTRSNKINLSPFQQNWLYNHYLHGGRSFIMLQTLDQRLLRVFPSSILHSPLRITSEPQLKVSYTGSAAGAAWARVSEFLLHSPLPRNAEDLSP
jgi:Holliday junction resolvase